MTIARSFSSAGAIASPLAFSNCQLWLDAADSSTVTLVSSKVSQWNDKSGNGRNFAQSNSTIRPTYADTTNGKSVITCAVSAGLNNATSALLRNVPGWSMFVVARWTTTPTGVNWGPVFGVSVSDVGDTSSNARAWMAVDANMYTMLRSRRLNADTVNVLTDTTANSTTKYAALSIVGNYSTTTATIYRNGVQTVQSTSWLSSGNTSNDGGGSFVGVHPSFAGNVAEIILFSTALDNAKRLKMESYLRNKWGTA